jgi:hypothetical protein
MDGSMFRHMYRDLAIFLAVCVALAFGAGALVMWGLPRVWDWLKPFIHQFTA